MGQWGAFGYAVRYHFGYERILDHFYGGTSEAQLAALGQPVDPTLRVVILENLNLKTNGGYDPVVTSAAGFTVVGSLPGAAPTPVTATAATSATSAPTTAAPPASSMTSATSTPTTAAPPAGSTTTSSPSSSTTSSSTATSFPAPSSTAPATPAAVTPGASVQVQAGTAVDLRLGSDGTWSVWEGASCTAARRAVATAAPVATGLVDPVIEPATASPTAPLGQLLTLCRHDGVDEALRGLVQAYDLGGFERTLNLVSLESYLDGVVPAEESAAWGLAGAAQGSPQGEPWGFQSLEAQAVAARSYALAYGAAGGWNGYADICDSSYCQAYVGAGYEQPVTDAAVADTTGEVRVAASSAGIISARYSASTGGWSAPGSFPAVPDLGDACVARDQPLECNPNHTWRVAVPAAAVARRFRAVGPVLGLRVAVRNRCGSLGGRALEVIVTGERGSRTVSGDTFAAALGLRSDWFAVARVVRRPRRPAAVPPTTASSLPPGGTTAPTSTSTSGAASTTVPSSLPPTTAPPTTAPPTTGPKTTSTPAPSTT